MKAFDRQLSLFRTRRSVAATALSLMMLLGMGVTVPAAPTSAAPEPDGIESGEAASFELEIGKDEVSSSFANFVAGTMLADTSTLVNASVVRGNGAGFGYLRTGRAVGFPTDGTQSAILSTGSIDDFFDSKENLASSDLGGAAYRGDSSFDVTVFRIDIRVPSTANCLVGMDFRYLSEEFPNFVGSRFNDAFIAELDTLSWTTSGSEIFAPGNFAFDPVGNPISVNAAGATSMFAGQAAGTVYGGATPLLRAATPITPGLHSIYLSIFDQGDRIFDSAVILDNLRFDNVDDLARDCRPGATNIDPASESDFTPITPSRLYESRAATTLDGISEATGRRPAGTTTEVQVAGRAGVPADATAAVLNLTLVQPANNGFVTVFPCGGPRPLASSMNHQRDNIAGAVVTQLGADGNVCIFNSQRTDLVVDLNGFFPATSTYVPIAPRRLLETRTGSQNVTTDGVGQRLGFRSAGTQTSVRIVGRAGVPSDAKAVTLTVSAVTPASAGFLTVYPCGALRPNASNVNYSAGRTIANTAVVQIGDGGAVCVYNSTGTHVVVDVAGFFPAGSSFIPLIPARLLETRTLPGVRTVDGIAQGIGARAAGSTTELRIAGRAGVPEGALSAILNLTAVNPAGDGFITVYPCGVKRPSASNLNFRAGTTIANTVVARTGDGGRVCIYTSARTHILADVTG